LRRRKGEGEEFEMDLLHLQLKGGNVCEHKREDRDRKLKMKIGTKGTYSKNIFDI